MMVSIDDWRVVSDGFVILICLGSYQLKLPVWIFEVCPGSFAVFFYNDFRSGRRTCRCDYCIEYTIFSRAHLSCWVLIWLEDVSDELILDGVTAHVKDTLMLARTSIFKWVGSCWGWFCLTIAIFLDFQSFLSIGYHCCWSQCYRWRFEDLIRS